MSHQLLIKDCSLVTFFNDGYNAIKILENIDLLVEENVMPLDAIPRHIGLAAFDIEMLAGLPEGYFQGKSNVVQFARLRTVQTNTEERVGKDSTGVLPFRTPHKP